jgi:hypothetical protein
MNYNILNTIIYNYNFTYFNNFNKNEIYFLTSYFKIYNNKQLIYINNNFNSIIKYKFHILNNYINNKYFIINDNLQYSKIFYVFYLYQKIYFAINKFKHIYKLKFKFKSYNCNTDLNLTPFNELNPNSIIELVENNTKYKFSIFDLIKIIKSSLFSNKYMFIKSKLPINPYTNLPFSFHNLYNIYFHAIFKSNIILPSFIYSFFQNNTSIDIFKKHNEYILNMNSITDYIDNEHYNVLFNDVKDMCYLINQFFPYYRLKPKNISSNKYQYNVNICKHLLLYYFAIQINKSGTDRYNDCVRLFKEQVILFMIKYPNFTKKKLRFYSSFNNNNRTLLYETFY